MLAAANEKPVDPFSDPFRDRLAQNDEDILDIFGDAGDEGDEELPEEITEIEEEPAESDMEGGDTATLAAEADVPNDLLLPQPEEPGVEQPESLELDFEEYEEPGYTDPDLDFDPEDTGELPAKRDETTEGERVYNDQDCGVAEEDCQEAWELVRAHDVTQISLDITPVYDPNAKSPELLEKTRDRKLSEAPRRNWTDRLDNVVADGRFYDYRNGRVSIETDDGSLTVLPLKDLSSDDACFVSAWWGMPSECRLVAEEFEGRHWVPLTYTWKASALCHKPLYFEQAQVERYGHSFGPIAQPIVSGAHFFAHVATLPYNMGINPPHECEYALGYYRPGNCAPYLFPPLPLSARGALYQAGTVTGLIYLIP